VVVNNECQLKALDDPPLNVQYPPLPPMKLTVGGTLPALAWAAYNGTFGFAFVVNPVNCFPLVAGSYFRNISAGRTTYWDSSTDIDPSLFQLPLSCLQLK
jgi:hypothetical protein